MQKRRTTIATGRASTIEGGEAVLEQRHALFAGRELQRLARRGVDHGAFDIAETIAAEHGHEVDDRGDRLLRIVAGALEHVDGGIGSRRELEVSTVQCLDQAAVLALGIDDHRVHARDRRLEHERADREALAVARGREHRDVGVAVPSGVERRDAHRETRADHRAEPVAVGIRAPRLDPGNARRRRGRIDQFDCAQRVHAERQCAHERGQVAEVRGLDADEGGGESKAENVAARIELVERVPPRGGDDGEVQGTSEIACQPFAQGRGGVEPDVHVHVGERAAFHLEHAVRGEVAQAAVEAAERVTEARRRQVDRDVALGLYAQQRSEPTRFDRMTREAAQRMTANEDVVDR